MYMGISFIANIRATKAMKPRNQGFDDRELRSLVYKTSKGEDRYILVRNGGTNTAGRMETYRIDMNTCQPISKSDFYDFHSQSHEFFLWHDPSNANRAYVAYSGYDVNTPGVPGHVFRVDRTGSTATMRPSRSWYAGGPTSPGWPRWSACASGCRC